MRALIANVDGQGRSCLVAETELVSTRSEASPIGTAIIFATETCPPGAAPPGHAVHVDLGLSPGIVRWLVVEFPPGEAAPLHHTDTVDFGFMVSRRHLESVLDEYVRHYNEARPHRGLQLTQPMGRPVTTRGGGITRRDILGGIIHEYDRAA